MGSSLVIHGNDALTTLDGLDSISSVGGGLSITGNQNLTDLGALSNLDSIGGGLHIINNDDLADLSPLGNISSVTELHISRNASLTSLDGLDGIVEVTGYDQQGGIMIVYSDALTDITALGNITGDVDSIVIFKNSALASLEGLNGITYVNSEIRMYRNDALTSLDGLSSLAFAGFRLEIYHNHALPTCEVCELVGQLVDEPNVYRVENNIEDDCDPFPDNCFMAPCADYTGDDPCCRIANPCEWELNDICDCDSACAWDAVDCEW
ncbi:MAG: hypothetical protein JRF63_10145 [Deltaproteobacteria bacterium]|nr:hypothetical protein [Deltaproteobacteria bacterium]